MSNLYSQNHFFLGQIKPLLSSANIFKGQRRVPIFPGELLKLYRSTPTFFLGTPKKKWGDVLDEVPKIRVNSQSPKMSQNLPKMFDEFTPTCRGSKFWVRQVKRQLWRGSCQSSALAMTRKTMENHPFLMCTFWWGCPIKCREYGGISSKALKLLAKVLTYSDIVEVLDIPNSWTLWLIMSLSMRSMGYLQW